MLKIWIISPQGGRDSCLQMHSKGLNFVTFLFSLKHPGVLKTCHFTHLWHEIVLESKNDNQLKFSYQAGYVNYHCNCTMESLPFENTLILCFFQMVLSVLSFWFKGCSNWSKEPGTCSYEKRRYITCKWKLISYLVKYLLKYKIRHAQTKVHHVLNIYDEQGGTFLKKSNSIFFINSLSNSSSSSL